MTALAVLLMSALVGCLIMLYRQTVAVEEAVTAGREAVQHAHELREDRELMRRAVIAIGDGILQSAGGMDNTTWMKVTEVLEYQADTIMHILRDDARRWQHDIIRLTVEKNAVHNPSTQD